MQQGFRPSIELLRFICAFGIVWFHMHAPGERLAYTALSLFLILAAFLAVGSLDRGGTRRFWIGRARRVALPWLAWSVFYLEVGRHIAEQPLTALTLEDPLSLLIGPTIHLWFLPFLLLASGAIACVRSRAEGIGVGGLALWGGAASLAALYLHTFVALPPPLAQWSFAVPAVCYGVLSAEAKKRGAEPALWAFVAGVGLAALASGATNGLMQLMIAVALFEAFWRTDARMRGMRALGSVSFGIYVTHPFFMLVYHKFFSGDGRSAAAVLFVFTLSALVSLAMLRTPVVNALV